MNEFISVYIVASSTQEGERIAKIIVNERLAPCVNLIPSIKSVYVWQGSVVEASECALVIKMASTGFDALEKRVRKLHSYECPCIVATPISEGSAPYLEWLSAAETNSFQ